MAHPSGTILVRKVPFPPVEQINGYDPDTQEPNIETFEHPLNKVKVIGPSPVSSSTNVMEEWNGIGGAQSIVQPAETFGAAVVAPDASLAAEYMVASMPDDTPTERVIPMVEKQQRLRSPEDVFAAEAHNAEQEAANAIAAAAQRQREATQAAHAQAAAKRGPGRPRKEETSDAS